MIIKAYFMTSYLTVCLELELAVQSLVDLMETEWINPFRGDPTELISLSTGTVAPSDVAIDLLTANACEEIAYKNFQDSERSLSMTHFPSRSWRPFRRLSWKQTTSCLAIWYLLQQAGSWTWDQCWPIHLDHCHGGLATVMAVHWKRQASPPWPDSWKKCIVSRSDTATITLIHRWHEPCSKSSWW